MRRRQFLQLGSATGVVMVGVLPKFAWGQGGEAGVERALRELEQTARGRLGVHVIDTGDGREWGHRSDERFLMLSTFKTLASALVLQRADRGLAPLDKRLRVRRHDLVQWSPVTERHVDARLSLAALCEATITTSDNTAANLILREVGGPGALTAFLRALGDDVTRLDRMEPELNEAAPGQEELDTTTPRAMARTLRTLLLGEALSPASRAQLLAWLKANTTGDRRLRAGLPADWAVGEKTGTAGPNANDAGIAWPPGRAPLLVSAYLADSAAPPELRERTLADVARLLARG